MASAAVVQNKSRVGHGRLGCMPLRIFSKLRNCLFSRDSKNAPLCVVRGIGNCYELNTGARIYDASGGAGVACLGREDARVRDAITKVMADGISYVPSLAFETEISVELANCMIESTGGMLSKAVFYSSGSECTEASLKMAIQYQTREKENPQPTRNKFIARRQSYHGATLGALSVSGHKARREIYRDILSNQISLISPCYPYADQNGRSEKQYVQDLKDEFENEILAMGPENVAGFIVEPVVGAALGCVPASDGYLQAMRDVCDKYGVLLIFDEVMCGLGRTGYQHAWQKENVVPDILLVGKGLAGGFLPISGMLLGEKIVKAFERDASSGVFNHGHTFQNHPLSAAAAVVVRKIIKEDRLLENVQEMGALLERKLKGRLGNHRFVGDIRGEGLFWGIEFVKNKQTKEPFECDQEVSMKIFRKGLEMPGGGIFVYPGGGGRGANGDHIIISPAYNVTEKEIDLIVDRFGRLVEGFFEDFIVPSEKSEK